MLNNFFTLKSQADFLGSVLPGSKITGISTHAKNKIVISLLSPEQKQYHLLLSLEKNYETLFLEDNFSMPGSNVFSFFEDIFGKEISSVDIQEYNRIVKIDLEESVSLFFSAIPSKSNLYLVSGDVIIDSFKEKNNYNSHSFSSLFAHKGSVNLKLPFKDRNDFNKQLSFLGKYYCDDLLLAVKNNGKAIGDINESDVMEYISGLNNSGVYLVYDERGNKICALKELQELGTFDRESFGDSNSMVRNCYYKSLTQNRKTDIRKSLLTDVDGKISKLEKKILNLKNNMNDTGVSDNLKHIGDLILGNIHLIKRGDKITIIDDFGSGGKVKIKLKENLSPSENADYYYSKFKGLKNSVNILQNKIAVFEKELELLRSKREKILMEENHKTLIKMEKKSETDGSEENLPFRVFKLSDKFEVWVGKSSASNDLLTMKYARQYDLWFHVRGYSGSHTVLRLMDKNDVPDKETIKKAASVAAYYSKARKGKHVPVAYCERKYVRKRKGMNQGAVIMEKEKVIFVDPELPGK